MREFFVTLGIVATLCTIAFIAAAANMAIWVAGGLLVACTVLATILTLLMAAAYDVGMLLYAGLKKRVVALWR